MERSTTFGLKRARAGVSHAFLDERSLAMHTEIAQIIRGEPGILEKAKATLARWIQQKGDDAPAALLEWQLIFNSHTDEEILEIIERDDQESRRLRQSNPFAAILPEKRRLEILREYEARRS